MNTKQQYDFKDLVHFSEKAVKDGVLKEMKIEYGVLTVITHKCGYLYSVSDHVTSDFIDSCMDSLKQEYEKQGVEFGDLKVNINGVSLEDLGKLDFNNLVSKAVQAVKDGLIIITYLDESALTIRERVESPLIVADSDDTYKQVFDFIESLYTETFTVESEDDVKRINWQEANTVLSNGEPFPLYVLYGYSADISIKAILCILKGATITQKRGK